MIIELENECEHFSDSDVLSISWMQDAECDRVGWLAAGNKNGSVSITKTVLPSEDEGDVVEGFGQKRDNYNLRNLKVPIKIVEWNPHHHKLATCSNSGSILVYHRVNNQWSVDLVNERAHAVEVFKWSRSSNQVMIGYTDGLLIVGSVSGHRLWHRMMDMYSALNHGTTFNHNPRPPNQHPLPRSDDEADNSNFNLFDVFRNNPEDTVVVSRNYRRTTDISTFYHTDSVNRYRYFNIQHGYRAPTDDNQPTEENRTNQPNASERPINTTISEVPGHFPISRLEDMPTLTCGTWSPNDVTITVATSVGSLLSFPYAWERLPLRLVRQRDRLLRLNDSIIQIEWSCQNFRRTDSSSNGGVSAHQLNFLLASRVNYTSEMSGSDTNSLVDSDYQIYDDSENFLLAVAFNSGYLYLLKNLEDTDPIKTQTGLSRLCISWNSSGTVLATGGFIRSANLECQCYVKLYSTNAEVIYSIPVPSMNKPIMSISWAHGDSRLFVTASVYVHTFRVKCTFPSLTETCCKVITNYLNNRSENIDKINLPSFLQKKIKSAFLKTIQGAIPLPYRLKEFVLLPKKELIYCVFNKISCGSGSTKYILYLEFLGTSIPLLVAVRSRTVKYEYTIYDPSLSQCTDNSNFPFEEVKEDHIACASFCTWQRKFRHQSRCKNRISGRNSYKLETENEGLSNISRKESLKKSNSIEPKKCKINELLLDDQLPETLSLAKLKSNVTLTKFELIGSQISLPRILCQINFGTGLKINPSTNISVQLIEIDSSTGWKMANYHRDLCLRFNGLTVSCFPDSYFLSGYRKPDDPVSNEPYVSCNDSTPSSCYSTPTHWYHSKQMKKKVSFSQIKSLPSTPQKINEKLNKRFRFIGFQNSHINYLDLSPPSFRSFFVTSSQSPVYRNDDNFRSSKLSSLFHENEQIVTCGRLEGDKYFLEFKYPFSPIQAFAFGISNTSRLFK